MSDAPAPTPPIETPPKPPVRFYFVGFAATIDRQSISKLMNVIGLIMERKPRPRAVILCLSSEGGLMDAAFYGFEILRALPIGIATHNCGLIASAANILFMAGNKRFASPHTSFLFHETRLPIAAPGIMRQDELSLNTKAIRQHDERLAALIAERTQKPIRAVRRLFGEKLRTPEFARDYGIIDGIQTLAIGDEDEFVQVAL